MSFLPLVLASASLSGCTPAIKEFAKSEWHAMKTYPYKNTAKQMSGWNDVFPPEKTFDEHMHDTYCYGPEWVGGRELVITGIEEPIPYGGCITQAPVPYEPHRLIGRP